MLFISTHNLATNPRLFKEIKLALKAGCKVEVICFEFDNWSKSLNESLKREISDARLITIPAGRKPLSPWLTSVALETLWRFIGKFILLPTPLLAQAFSRRNFLIIKALENVSEPDWVIGHNPGALWATVVAGKKFSCKAGFDVEDYHPGEGNDKLMQLVAAKLLKKTLPVFNYVSFASPLIKNEIENEVGIKRPSWFTMMNVFPGKEFVPPTTKINTKVKFVWLSQNISSSRGLELVLPAFIEMEESIELHLFGNLDSNFFEEHLKNRKNIFVHSPLPQVQLHEQLGGYDIGLALEPSKDRNNELAVSNKLLAYLQAGLFVLATDTPAQASVLSGFPEHGFVFNRFENDSKVFINKIVVNIHEILENSTRRYEHMKNFNWETESVKLLETWQN